MFESISSSLQKVFQRFGQSRRLTEDNMQEGLREIRTALLEADVNFKVARDLIKEVTERAKGEEVVQSVTPGQMIVKIFQDVLTEMMGSTESGIQFDDLTLGGDYSDSLAYGHSKLANVLFANELARRFELQVKMMQTAEENARQGASIMDPV